MNSSIAGAALALAAAACLSACASLGTGGDNAAALKVVGEHLDKCDRSYTGGTGFGGAFTFHIECHAQPPAATPAATPAAPGLTIGDLVAAPPP